MVGWAVTVMSMIASPAVLRVRHSAGIDETALGSEATIDFEGSVPWRTFRWHHGQAHYSGLYWSAVMGGHVGYESRLELAWLLLADREPSTRRIYSQPFQLSTVVDERVRRHVPDFLAVRDDGLVTVVDVKPGRRLGDPVVASTFGWARRVIEAEGWRFEVFTEPPSTVLANVRFLAGYRRGGQFDAHVLSMVLNLAAVPVTFAGVDAAGTAIRTSPRLCRTCWRPGTWVWFPTARNGASYCGWRPSGPHWNSRHLRTHRPCRPVARPASRRPARSAVGPRATGRAVPAGSDRGLAGEDILPPAKTLIITAN